MGRVEERRSKGNEQGAREPSGVVAAGDRNDISSKTCSAPPPEYRCVRIRVRVLVDVGVQAMWAVDLFNGRATKPFGTHVLTST